MEKELIYILRKFYDKLMQSFLYEKKLKNNSILISMMEVKSNIRYRILMDASISIYELPKTILDTLLNRGLIAESDEPDRFFITAKGVWAIEKSNEDTLVKFINNKFFNVSQNNKKISDKEKIILFSMISARTFSPDSSIDLKKDHYTLDAWIRIIDSTSKKLLEMGVIKEITLSNLYGKSGNEHKVSHLIRHTDALPKKTKGLFMAAGNQKYYLNVTSNDRYLHKEKISYILSLIFDDENLKKYETIIEVESFCKELAYQEAPFLFNIGEDNFTSHEYDDIITEAINESILLR
ncbi:hypothetical protein DRW41_05025 [Neobacillus piezotolerans]|uniref:Uncharacterized protein n=1 Tax=Neobacillus piezotolerans TaxID=2259171 RepID=A0A3D8GWT9_9BACI|nr:hypothetical protein [Neobacillus piezotolerans]RDU38920.1 hypothetical protein DRW41_05025 [Neobacillus piezotolerans]